MGTNYYLQTNQCKCCNRHDEIHIGKSSFGWYFALHVTDELDSLDKWKEKLSNEENIIIDEYGDPLSYDKLFKIMTDRKPASDAFLEGSRATLGMHDLLKPNLDDHCIGHAEDLPISYISGDFS